MLLRLGIIVVLALLSQGCGRKGSLILIPTAQPAQSTPATSSVPSTQTQP